MASLPSQSQLSLRFIQRPSRLRRSSDYTLPPGEIEAKQQEAARAQCDESVMSDGSTLTMDADFAQAFTSAEMPRPTKAQIAELWCPKPNLRLPAKCLLRSRTTSLVDGENNDSFDDDDDLGPVSSGMSPFSSFRGEAPAGAEYEVDGPPPLPTTSQSRLQLKVMRAEGKMRDLEAALAAERAEKDATIQRLESLLLQANVRASIAEEKCRQLEARAAAGGGGGQGHL